MAENLSEEQVAELKQAFNEFDVDGGGTINTKELGWAMRAMGMNPTENEFPEFCNMMSHKMSYAEDEEMVKLAFRTLDKDGSGTIATSEFKHLMTHIGKKQCNLEV